MGFPGALLIRVSLTGIAILLLGNCLPAHAQRVTSVDGSIDVGGGMNNYPTQTFTGETSNWQEFYNVSPSAYVTSRTARSALTLGYSFGWNYYGSELARHSTSHGVSLALSRELSPRWSLRVSDYYSRTNDLYTFYALRGAEIQEEGLVLYFYPVTTNTSIGTNSLSVSVDHTLSPRSELSFTASHSIGLYGTGQAAAPLVGLSDLQTISATASYTRRLNDRTSLSVGYNGSYFGFDSFDGAVSTAVTVGLSTVVAKDTTFDISAGPSRVSNVSVEGSNNTNLAASVSLSKRIEKNSFSFSLSNNNATASGVGSVSNTRSAIASVSRPLSRRVSIYGNFSAYDGTGIVGNPFRTRGISATANVGYSLARNLSLHGGFQYQRYIHPVQYAYTQKGVFVSLRYSHPNLLRSR